jgi:hypothetical protein
LIPRGTLSSAHPKKATCKEIKSNPNKAIGDILFITIDPGSAD